MASVLRLAIGIVGLGVLGIGMVLLARYESQRDLEQLTTVTAPHQGTVGDKAKQK